MNELTRLEYNGQAILITEQLANAYECDISNIQDKSNVS